MIKDTIQEERERIVAEPIGNFDGACDGCAAGLVKMYRDYIAGKTEIREITREFCARYISGTDGLEKSECFFVG